VKLARRCVRKDLRLCDSILQVSVTVRENCRKMHWLRTFGGDPSGLFVPDTVLGNDFFVEKYELIAILAGNVAEPSLHC